MNSPADTLDVLTVGRSCIDLYAHQIGVPITEVTSFDAYVGGCPTNISVGTRRLGLRSGLLTAVGDDQVADFVLAFLQREGVDTRFIPRKPGRRTSAVILTILPPDRFPLTFYREGCADRELTCDDVRNAPIERCSSVIVTGTGLSHEPARSATLFAAQRACDAGRRVLVDIDYRADQWSSRQQFAALLQSMLRMAELAVGTEEEVRAAADVDDTGEAVARLLACGLNALILKRGGDGAVIHAPGASPRPVPPWNLPGCATRGGTPVPRPSRPVGSRDRSRRTAGSRRGRRAHQPRRPAPGRRGRSRPDEGTTRSRSTCRAGR